MIDNHARDPDIARLYGHFSYHHLPSHLQHVSRHFSVLADTLVGILPDSGDLRDALADLLRAKDCAVRAAVAAHDEVSKKSGWSGARS